jgi:DNA-binding transcriptional MerR regulator
MTALPAASIRPPTITVRDAAARLDVTPRTLKYYEELGIVVPVRSVGGYRLYEQADLDKLARVLRMRSLGFSLPVITAMLQQPVEAPAEGGRPRLSNASLKALRETLTGQLGTLDARVAQVRRELKEAAAAAGAAAPRPRLRGTPAGRRAGGRGAARSAAQERPAP